MAKHNGAVTGGTNGGSGLLKIDVRDGDQLAEFCNKNQTLCVADMDFLETLRLALADRLYKELKRRGMEHTNLLGSDARRTAKRITRHLRHIAAAQKEIASAFNVLWGDYVHLFQEPIRQIEEAKEEFKV